LVVSVKFWFAKPRAVSALVCSAGDAMRASSYVKKNHARSFMIGPPSVPTYRLLFLSNFERASELPVTSSTVVLSAFQSSLLSNHLNAPSNRFVPDFVMTSTIAPVPRPYSTPTADVRTTIS
jgi:hypothetical protein